jgi:exodeoxyribonuclease-3
VRLITSNVNGVRAAARKQGLAELLGQYPDVITLQEVRSSSVQLVEVLAAEGFRDWSVVHAPCRDQPGRNGVAVLSVQPITATTAGLPQFEDEGRWIEATVGPLTVVSTYVPKGHAGEPVQEHKMAFLAAATRRMRELARSGADVIVTGDLNIARTEADLKNWRQRIGKSGFLPEERDVLDSWEGDGWVDLGRALSGPGPGPYTWWSQRGRAFDNDAGWRIDYVWATPRVAQRATAARVLRASSWDARWSDHAAVLVEFARGEGLPDST